MRLMTKLLAATAGAVLLVGGGIGVVSAATSSDHDDTASSQPVVQSNQPSDREDRGLTTATRPRTARTATPTGTTRP